MEDPNLHLLIFSKVCDRLRLSSVFNDAIYLQLFPFSLKDKALVWLYSLSPRLITTLDEIQVLHWQILPTSQAGKFEESNDNLYSKVE